MSLTRMCACVLTVFSMCFSGLFPADAVSPYETNRVVSTANRDSDTITIGITPDSPFLVVGQSIQLRIAQSLSPIWTSDDPEIASVGVTDGIVTARSSGTTTVRLYYLKADGTVVRGSCKVDVVKEVPVEEGKYFLKFTSTKDFRLSPGTDFPSSFYIPERTYTPKVTASTSLASMQLMFNNTQWTIEELEDGYYTIANSSFPSYVLATASSDTSTSTEVVLKERPDAVQLLSDSRVRWKFYSSRGYVVLIPKCAEGTGFVLSATAPGEGQSVCLKRFDFRSVGSFWDLYSTTFYIDNYYDESIVENSLDMYMQAISQANTKLKWYFKKAFGVDIQSNGSIAYQSVTDTCPVGNSSACNSGQCGDDCSRHHKNISGITQKVSRYERSNNHAVVQWSNRSEAVYCCESSTAVGGTTVRAHRICESVPLAQADSGSCSVTFFTAVDFSGEYQLFPYTTFLLMHEMSHLFGIPDVYNQSWHDRQDCFCVMKRYNREEAQLIYNRYLNDPDSLQNAPSLFCDSCYEDLQEKIYCVLFPGFPGIN